MARLAHLIPAPLRPAYARVRGMLRRFESMPMTEPLAESAAKAAIHALSPAVVADRGTPFRFAIRLVNHGSAIWSGQGSHPVHLRGRWLTSRKQPTDIADHMISLPRMLRPGESIDITQTATAPAAVGQYLFEWQPVQINGPSFVVKPRAAMIDVQVTAPATEEIDYHKVYATAELNDDYWTVVGPPTQAEFHRLSHVKREQLIEQGLTPDSWVLDVGCGTGQLAAGLIDYLSDRGGYVGTDCGPEAIAFCQTKYPRPNFRFHVNDFTSLPPLSERFDLATFFSVFTHTYPDETLLLLSETAKLLKPGGAIIGDVFTSPLTDRCAGNRGAVELNREHFLRLVAIAGLQVEVVASWAWKAHATREVLRFRKIKPSVQQVDC
jgi:ubiquinone/menaquinone biosynthesis C-methylase UbiE